MMYPIIIWEEQEIVIDGNHRLGHAAINNFESINAYLFDNELMDKIKLGMFNNSIEYDEIVGKYSMDNGQELFSKNFMKNID